MITENRVHLEVDQYSRIGIKDVINMLKGLRNEAAFKIVKKSEISKYAKGLDNNNKSRKKSKQNNSTPYSFKNSPSVKGNSNIPHIRVLNEIAALLRSMDLQQRLLSS